MRARFAPLVRPEIRRVGMGEVVHDGPLAFTAIDAFPLYDAFCFGGDFVRAQGQFLYVVVDVTNVGARPHTYAADHQRLVATNGRAYFPDLKTISVTPGRFARRFADLVPGQTVRSLLLFDVPRGTSETDYQLSLHSSAQPSRASVSLARGTVISPHG